MNNTKGKYNLAAFFSGVGGIELGFEQTGKFNIVYANEFDKNARITYIRNFGDSFLDPRDIHDVEPNDIKDNIDIIVGGFPCQAFSIAGYRKGFEDERGDLFFELLRLIQAKKPKAIFIENVKNLVSHEKGNTFKVIREALTINGYFIKWKVLNSKDYGNIPQNRERIYLVGFTDKKAFDKFKFPEQIELSTPLADIIEYDTKQDEKYYYRKHKQKFYDELEKNITNKDSVYQWRRQYVRENKSGVIPTLTANMGTGGHNVPLVLTKSGIRKLTPRETFNAQGFPTDYNLPEIANGQLYKQAGNSVVVPVIKRIANELVKALDESSEIINSDEINGKYAILKNEINGKFEGNSFTVSIVNSMNEAEDLIQSYKDGLKILDDLQYLNVINKGSHEKFYSIVPL